MNIIKRLWGKSEESAEILCPHCEHAMEPGHKCSAMSRRYFFGVLAGAASAAMVTPEPKVYFSRELILTVYETGYEFSLTPEYQRFKLVVGAIKGTKAKELINEQRKIRDTDKLPGWRLHSATHLFG